MRLLSPLYIKKTSSKRPLDLREEKSPLDQQTFPPSRSLLKLYSSDLVDNDLKYLIPFGAR
jgi:hypothetical protein